MKKVLIMNDLVYGGGVEKVMLDIATHISKGNFEVTILTPCYDNNFYKIFNTNINYKSINIIPLMSYETMLEIGRAHV